MWELDCAVMPGPKYTRHVTRSLNTCQSKDMVTVPLSLLDTWSLYCTVHFSVRTLHFLLLDT